MGTQRNIDDLLGPSNIEDEGQEDKRGQINSKIAIYLEPREDGGLRVWSNDIPGLILSHSDQRKVIASIGPAIQALLNHKSQQRKT